LSAFVHIVDDDESFRVSTSRLLHASGYEVVMYESAEQFLRRVPDDPIPGCILLDVGMPGLNGPELQTHLVELGCALPIVFVTGQGVIPTTVQALKAGAQDFLTKPVPKDKLIEAIECAVAHFQRSQQQIDQLNSLRDLVGTLTPREWQVFELLARGGTNKQIGRELGATERTVKAHRHQVMEKLRIKSVAEVTLIALKLGLLSTSVEQQAHELGHYSKQGPRERSQHPRSV
jgi:FixJ family two-component response regulator